MQEMTPILRLRSFKFWHRRRPAARGRKRLGARSQVGSMADHPRSCDIETRKPRPVRQCLESSNRWRRKPLLQPLLPLLLLLMLALSSSWIIIEPAGAFCPSRCHCDDLQLSANCTQVQSISIVPMTLNPLLKRLTLNQLPLFELSNSLSVYRQLEALDLDGNQLRQIRYHNFNFKRAPHSMSLRQPAAEAGPRLGHHPNHHHLFSEHNEQLARQHRQAIDRSLRDHLSAEDEIRLHLRQLRLADNRIEQLGEPSESDLAGEPAANGEAANLEERRSSRQPSGGHHRRLASNELERLAPFLTLTKLELLDLSGNRLSRLHQHVLLGLVQLKSLDLSRNQLEYIDKHAFVGLIGLEKLKLSQNKLAGQLSSIGLAACRAPMNELSHLDLSENLKSLSSASPTSAPPPREPPELLLAPSHLSEPNLAILPNQMFICLPKLLDLNLAALQLRYIQVNAFDNLRQLQALNLSRNHLEQVPVESLSYSNSNLSATLRQLDLSETLIDFVGTYSLGSLRKLERLKMNSMPRLVSFDLASLLPADASLDLNSNYYQQQQFGSGAEPLATASSNLQELDLGRNQHLQSLYSSLRPAQGLLPHLRLLDLAHSRGLSELALEQVIDSAPPFGAQSNNQPRLTVDLSHVSSLNCSSCKLNWLLDTFKRQNRWPEATTSGSNPPGLAWTPIPFDPFEPYRRPPAADQRIVVVAEALGCSWPYAMRLADLVNLEASGSIAPLLGRCYQPAPPRGGPVDQAMMRQLEDQMIGGRTNSNPAERDLVLVKTRPEGPPQGMLVVVISVVGLVASAAVAAKLIIFLVRRRQSDRYRFDWRSAASLATSSIQSPASSNCSSNSGSQHNNQPATYGPSVIGPIRPIPFQGNQMDVDVRVGQLKVGAERPVSGEHHNHGYGDCSSNLLLFNNVPDGRPADQFGARAGELKGRGNLFSRIAGRLSGSTSTMKSRQQQQQLRAPGPKWRGPIASGGGHMTVAGQKSAGSCQTRLGRQFASGAEVSFANREPIVRDLNWAQQQRQRLELHPAELVYGRAAGLGGGGEVGGPPFRPSDALQKAATRGLISSQAPGPIENSAPVYRMPESALYEQVGGPTAGGRPNEPGQVVEGFVYAN